jgi:hypothetical protein
VPASIQLDATQAKLEVIQGDSFVELSADSVASDFGREAVVFVADCHAWIATNPADWGLIDIANANVTRFDPVRSSNCVPPGSALKTTQSACRSAFQA